MHFLCLKISTVFITVRELQLQVTQTRMPLQPRVHRHLKRLKECLLLHGTRVVALQVLPLHQWLSTSRTPLVNELFNVLRQLYHEWFILGTVPHQIIEIGRCRRDHLSDQLFQTVLFQCVVTHLQHLLNSLSDHCFMSIVCCQHI